MVAKVWPNGLGWDIGQSEVRDCVSKLKCFTPAGKDHHRVATFPLGTDPILCVELTKSRGLRREDHYWCYDNAPNPIPHIEP